ncbi:hypothetical protein [Devosia faecipullorum]|uniref:hypothetical protein n=1 Tax=Devosia faecipullorum TaxID=2755039 RepID=UPI00187B4540|nr:hypothetical protein [Devosia faecipullorum]MBE7732380.1 hypothetical protein [Devosia faecipullorum]
MHISASPRRRKIGLIALFGILVPVSAAMALMAGITPALAADIARQPDTQVAVFMVPLTLLVLALLFEAARFIRRGALPAQSSVRPARPLHWPQDRRKG